MDHELSAKFRTGGGLCPHADTCPGCPLLDLSYPEQLTRKHESVRSELAAYPELAEIEVSVTEPAARTLGYRTRAKLVAAGPRLGLYARTGHEVLDLPHCRVLAPEVAEVVAALRDLLPSAELLAGVDVARAGASILVTLIALESTPESTLAALGHQLRTRCPAIAGVAFTRRAEGSVQLLATGHTLLSGELAVKQAEASGPYHYVSHGAFVQAHVDVAQRIYAALGARVFAAGLARPRVLELYAGSGSLSLSLSARGAEVVAIESYGPACERLARAAAEQSLPVRVLQGDAGRQLRTLQGQAFDVVLVNPPRRGLEPDVRSQIAALAPAAVGYVSCRPSTLARDLAHFVRLGLAPLSIAPFDMMPQTFQVETLAWLEPRVAPRPSFHESAAGLLTGDKPPFMAMAQLTAEARKLPGWESATPLHELSAESSGLVPFARALPIAAGASARVPTFSVLARGVLRGRGNVRGRGSRSVRYVRERVIGGHSLLRVQANDEQSVRRALGSLGHPVLGDARLDVKSARYFALRHGLDRCFLHLGQLASSASEAGHPEHDARAPSHSALPPDLAAVLRSLEAPDARGRDPGA